MQPIVFFAHTLLFTGGIEHEASANRLKSLVPLKELDPNSVRPFFFVPLSPSTSNSRSGAYNIPELPFFSSEEVVATSQKLAYRALDLATPGALEAKPTRPQNDIDERSSSLSAAMKPPWLYHVDQVPVEEAAMIKACFQLYILVMFDRWNVLKSRMDGIHENIGALKITRRYGSQFKWWEHALHEACARRNRKVIHVILDFFLPNCQDLKSRRRSLKIDAAGRTMLHSLATGILTEHAQSVNPDGHVFTPDIFGIFRTYCSNPEILMTTDFSGKTPLHLVLTEEGGSGRVAAHSATRSIDKLTDWATESTLRIVGSQPDNDQFTPLHYACMVGRRFGLAKRLIEAGASVNALTQSLETPLHLLFHSDRAGTPILDLVKLLCQKGADLGAALSDGSTPLHLAVEHHSIGGANVVSVMLAALHDRKSMHPMDALQRTPMMLTPKIHIKHLFAPWQHVPTSSACKTYPAVRCYWGPEVLEDYNCCVTSVHDLLYKKEDSVFAKKVPQLKSKETVRWIHLPANNIEWCDELLTRWYLEDTGHPDTEGLKAARRAFELQHATHDSGWQGRFLQPGVQMYLPLDALKRTESPTEINQSLPTKTSETVNTTPESSNKSRPASKLRNPVSSLKRGYSTAKSRQPPPRQRHIFIAVPYLQFERSTNVRQMKQTLQSSHKDATESSDSASVDNAIYSIYGGEETFHPRRTLDQFFYPNMDTSARDNDQVVQRCQAYMMQANTKSGARDQLNNNPEKQPEGTPEDLNTIMVDQMWIWIIGDDLILTSFPKRWDTSKHSFKADSPDMSDPYGTFEGIRDYALRDAAHDAGLRQPKTASDLAMRAMMHCFGTFDRHVRQQPALQFLGMFEQTIGKIGASESLLYKDFDSAYHVLSETDTAENLAGLQKLSPQQAEFVKKVNNLEAETRLLAELKDVRDELSMMKMIFEDQQRVVRELESFQKKLKRHNLRPLFDSTSSGFATFGDLAESHWDDEDGSFDALNSILDRSFKDLARLDVQAARFSESLSELLELKQAHSNAFELNFSRAMALDSARQARAVMIFTVVTILFLPLSFIAAFFSMPLTRYKSNLSFSYAAKYIFSIGLAIALPLIFLAFYASGDIILWWKKIWEAFGKLTKLTAHKPLDVSAPHDEVTIVGGLNFSRMAPLTRSAQDPVANGNKPINSSDRSVSEVTQEADTTRNHSIWRRKRRAVQPSRAPRAFILPRWKFDD